MAEDINNENKKEDGKNTPNNKGINRTKEPEEEISFEERFKQTVEVVRPYFTRLWAAKKKFVFINFIVAVVFALILVFLKHNYYRSTITILPDYGNKQNTLSQLSGLASLAGVNVGNSSPTQIYQNLVTSEAVLRPVIYAKYKTEKYPDSAVNLIQYFKIKPNKNLPPALQKRKMFLQEMKGLANGRVSTDIDRMTQILTITVTMPEPQLSADVVNKIVESLENYVQTQRKSYASDQEKYISKRIGQVKDSLALAEDTLTKFNEQNRDITQSPQLQLQQTRLIRNVTILNSVYLELKKQLELAKIDEINDTPIINVRDYAKNPIVKAGPHRASILIIILFFSSIISGAYLVFKDDLKRYWGYVKK